MSEEHNTQEVRVDQRKRVEFADDDSTLAQALTALDEYRRATERENHMGAAVLAYGAERLAVQLTNETLATAVGHGPSARGIAKRLGLSHGGVNRRIHRARQQQEGTVRKTVLGSRLRAGDLITDDNGGSYEQYGRVTDVTRRGVSYVATTESGQELSFLPIDFVEVLR